MKVLNVFVDESGHFGMKTKHSPYYIVSFVFYDQSVDISDLSSEYDIRLSLLGYEHHFVHTEPIIRGESVYEDISLVDRRKLFNCLCRFTSKCPIHHKTFIFKKGDSDSKLQMIHKMSREISLFLQSHATFLASFDVVKLHYDNGQSEITAILTTVLSHFISNLEFKRSDVFEYKLFQAADLFCTIALTQQKFLDAGHLSRSETCFFKSYQNFKKNFLSLYKRLEMVD